jgi:hypothetical protein
VFSFHDEHDNLFEIFSLRPPSREFKTLAGAAEYRSHYIPQHFMKHSSERYILNDTNGKDLLNSTEIISVVVASFILSHWIASSTTVKMEYSLGSRKLILQSLLGPEHVPHSSRSNPETEIRH